MTDRRKEIKKRLRELKANPGQPGATEETQRLHGEYRRLSRPQRTPALSRQVVEPGVSDAEAEAIGTWPDELRARLRRSAMNRVIDRNTLEDPGGWGYKNDLRNR